MPEEINRVLTDQISDLLFITSPEAKKNLIREGKSDSQIFFVGNTMIDSLVKFEKLFNCNKILENNNLIKRDFVLVTLHRPSNVDAPEKLNTVANALNRISESKPIIWPIHPRTRKRLAEQKIKLNQKIIITEPIGYLEFMGLQKNANLIITDSGGVQEESTYFGVPCFTVRDNTERPITIEHGTNILVGTDFIKLPNIILKNTNKRIKSTVIPKKWDGKASQRISSVISNIIGQY